MLTYTYSHPAKLETPQVKSAPLHTIYASHGHFPDFDAALRKAIELATGGEPTVTFKTKKNDVVTGTEVELIGSNKSKIVFDPPHADMDPKIGHDKPHVGVQTGGKGKLKKKCNLTYDGEQHPYRSANKGEGIICH